MRKWRWVGVRRLRKGDESIKKKSIGLESACSRKERKTEANLEKDHFGGNRKMRQNTERD
jgi:hypothetical protein